MLKISKSTCICGVCGKVFELEWDIEDIMFGSNRPMGEEVVYVGEAVGECPRCGMKIEAELIFTEYPMGAIEGEPHIEVKGEDTIHINTIVNIPDIDLVDF